MKLFGEIEEYVVYIDIEAGCMIVDIYGEDHSKGVLVTREMSSNNVIKISEQLRDWIGFGHALQFLNEQGVPADHNLRYLGRGWDWKGK